MTLLEKLAVRVGQTDGGADAILSEILDGARAFLVAYCHLDGYDASLDPLLLKLAAEDYRRLGSEGIERRNFSGVYESYHDGYSDALTRELNAHRRLRAL